MNRSQDHMMRRCAWPPSGALRSARSISGCAWCLDGCSDFDNASLPPAHHALTTPPACFWKPEARLATLAFIGRVSLLGDRSAEPPAQCPSISPAARGGGLPDFIPPDHQGHSTPRETSVPNVLQYPPAIDPPHPARSHPAATSLSPTKPTLPLNFPPTPPPILHRS